MTAVWPEEPGTKVGCTVVAWLLVLVVIVLGWNTVMGLLQV